MSAELLHRHHYATLYTGILKFGSRASGLVSLDPCRRARRRNSCLLVPGRVHAGAQARHQKIYPPFGNVFAYIDAYILIRRRDMESRRSEHSIRA